MSLFSRMTTIALLTTLALFSSADVRHPLDLAKRSAVIDHILSERIETVLPSLMRRSGLDCWIMVSREYNEDPVLKTFLPSSWFSARRRTILMIFDHGPDQPLETLAVARYAVGKQFKSAWDPESMPDQWHACTRSSMSGNQRA